MSSAPAPRSFRPSACAKAGWPAGLEDVRGDRRIQVVFAAVTPAGRPSILAVVRRIVVDGLPTYETEEWSVGCVDGGQAMRRRSWLEGHAGVLHDACAFADAFGCLESELARVLERADEETDRA